MTFKNRNHQLGFKLNSKIHECNFENAPVQQTSPGVTDTVHALGLH